LIDFGIRLAKDEDRISRGFESAFSGLLIRGRLFLLALGNSAKTLDTRQFFIGQFESRRRANQVRLRLNEVGALDGVEGLVFLNPGAKFRKSLEDRSLISGEDLN